MFRLAHRTSETCSTLCRPSGRSFPITRTGHPMGRVNRNALNAVHIDYARDKAFRALRGNGHVRNPLIAGEGADEPQVFIAGESPGATEVLRMRPYVGSAGILLRRLMELANLYTTDSACGPPPANCWLTNTVKFRPPRREPTVEEITASAPYLVREWKAVGEPSVIVCVGVASYLAVTGRWPTGKLAGKPHDGHDGRTIWPMFSPMYGMRSTDSRPAMEAHWQALGAWLDARNS